jgi:hypothetical protein
MKKPNKLPASGIILIPVFLILLAGGFFYSSRAKAISPNLFGTAEAGQPKLVTATPAGSSAVANPEENTAGAVPPAEVAESPEESIADAEDRVQNWEKTVFAQPGWLHFVYSMASAVENGVLLPDGASMPAQSQTDGWYHIDEQGRVDQHLITLQDASGALLQQEVFKGDTMLNRTTGEKLSGVEPYPLKLDLGMGSDIRAMQAAGGLAQHQDALVAGQAVDDYSVTGIYDQAVTLSNSPAPVKSIRLALALAKADGALVRTQTIFQLEDGTEVLFAEVHLLSLERAELPDRLLSAFQSLSD